MAKGDGFHGSVGRKATFFIVQRRQLSWILEPVMATFLMVSRAAAFSKTGHKRAQKPYFGPARRLLSTFGTLWQAPVPNLSLV